MQLLLIMSVDYRLPKHISAHIKRQQAAKKAQAQNLAPIYTESTIMSPVKREEPEGSDSRVDIQNPLFKDPEEQIRDPLDAVAAQHDSAVASFAGASSLEAPEGAPPLSRGSYCHAFRMQKVLCSSIWCSGVPSATSPCSASMPGDVWKCSAVQSTMILHAVTTCSRALQASSSRGWVAVQAWRTSSGRRTGRR